mmetsp:Transcript_46227/g.74124  ORF Transcript_46227/g.74124 Transcript_46227/m.74124 type:complete len:82 (-) Transcript_46227:883-1128(-)
MNRKGKIMINLGLLNHSKQDSKILEISKINFHQKKLKEYFSNFSVILVVEKAKQALLLEPTSIMTMILAVLALEDLAECLG